MKEDSIYFPEFIEHETVVKMEPKERFRVRLQIREFRKAEPPKIAKSEVLVVNPLKNSRGRLFYIFLPQRFK